MLGRVLKLIYSRRKVTFLVLQPRLEISQGNFASPKIIMAAMKTNNNLREIITGKMKSRWVN